MGVEGGERPGGGGGGGVDRGEVADKVRAAVVGFMKPHENGNGGGWTYVYETTLMSLVEGVRGPESSARNLSTRLGRCFAAISLCDASKG